MFTISNEFKEQVISKQVAARLAGVTLTSIPYTYQAIDRFRELDNHSQVVLSRHLLNKLSTRINSWLAPYSETGLKEHVGINDKERYGIYKGAPEYIEEYLLPVLATFENDLEFYEINDHYQSIRNRLSETITDIETRHASGRGKFTKRFKEFAPEVVQYLSGAQNIVEELKSAFYL